MTAVDGATKQFPVVNTQGARHAFRWDWRQMHSKAQAKDKFMNLLRLWVPRAGDISSMAKSRTTNRLNFHGMVPKTAFIDLQRPDFGFKR
jgi:hypothetical protein